jgi:hypothetical protein
VVADSMANASNAGVELTNAQKAEVLQRIAKEDAAKQATESAGKFTSKLKAFAGKHADSLVGAGLASAAAALGNRYIMPKLVPKPSMFKRVTDSMGTAAGFGLGGLALGGGVWGASKAFSALTEPAIKQKHYNEMLKENPSLRNEDPAVVRKSYNTLFTFNKDMAKDPTTAGAFVRRAAAFKDEGIQASDIKTLTEIRKFISDSKSKDTKFVDNGAGIFKFDGSN